MSKYILVGAVFEERLCLCHLEIIHPGLVGVEGVELVFGKVINDTCSVRVPDHVDRGAETVPGVEAGTQQIQPQVSQLPESGQYGIVLRGYRVRPGSEPTRTHDPRGKAV